MEINKSSVPTMGSLDGRAEVAGVPGSDHRAEGVAYPAESMTSLDGGAYPEGTRMTDKTPGDNVN